MEAEHSGRRNSNTQLLDELEALSQSLYRTHHTSTTNRRTASLTLPRTSVPPIPTSIDDEIVTAKIEDTRPINNKPRSRRMSLSPWRSRPKLEDENDQRNSTKATQKTEIKLEERATLAKKGIWNWKPIRALSHIGMQKLSCLFSVEVVTAQGLPASMNGLRLSVCVRKKETKDGAVQTMPSRVSQGAADFEETLFVRCHVYCTSPGNGKQTKFEPRPFWIYVFAVDAAELGFGKSFVDLSQLIQESIEKNQQGARVRQWDVSFNLSGKAKGGELVLKLGFQIMEKDGGIGIYNQEELKSGKSRKFSSSFALKQSKTSFSEPSPMMITRKDAWTPSRTGTRGDLQVIDDLNLDEPDPGQVQSTSPSEQKLEEPALKIEDVDLPDFEVVDKGVEVQDKEADGEEESEKSMEVKSVSSEVVKEALHDPLHLTMLTELDSIAQQLKALESKMGEEYRAIKTEEETDSQRLDEDEETITKEFLQKLEGEEGKGYKVNKLDIHPLLLKEEENSPEAEYKVYLPDLGKGLGCVVQTRDGGCLASMNPLDNVVARKDIPKLAMQMSKPFILPSCQSLSGFELFHQMAAIGFDELSSQILNMMAMDELTGKTAEQIAFEGIASTIIQGRNKEGASSSAARTIAAVKSMANSMTTGRKDRISTGIWNVNENPLTAEEILAFSMQKIETMTVEALKIQAGMAEEEAPFDVSTLNTNTFAGAGGKDQINPLASAISLEDWIKIQGNNYLASPNTEPEDAAIVTVMVVVQLRDPLRRYEAVGCPVIVLIHATPANTKGEDYEEEVKFKVTSLHVGGLKVRTAGKRNSWDIEKQRLTAMQWLVAYGLGKAGKKGKHVWSKGHDLLWSISSRIMANMWLKPIRNPDVKFAKC
ncbi:protein PLASTID MOVEMENT IMPAIRED 1 [Quillaja saponaria]|uniref:Protein PLASTID MOVEMENT IMPAIRED 1 n=1 Tax=Quillaja saponaria TaxID=32244 RepID=A0AAD7M6B4_QUISA|nr:protein PLASTID MOVEMENT IMPAIRED 1 [Quillaja saponaria]